MKPRLLLVAAVASSIAILAACGGAKDNELFANPSSDLGTDTNGTEPPAASSSGGSSGATASGSSGTTSSGGSSGGTTSSSGGSSGGSSGSTNDAGTSSGGTTTSKGTWCGEDADGDDIYCKAGTACCAKTGGAPSLECTTSGVSCSGGLAIKCDDQTDCPSGQVCCGTFEENVGYKAVQCSPSCATAGSLKAVRFCDQNATVDECNAWGKTCQWSQGLPGYSICK